MYSLYRESKVEKDLINAGTFREIRLENFIENQIESNNFSFHEPIKKNKLRIFGIAIITKIIEVSGKDVSKKNDGETFTRLLGIQRNYEIDIKEVLCYELPLVPLVLPNPDTPSTLSKTANNELFKFLKISFGTVLVISMNTPKIYDGMVLFQRLPTTLSTLG